MSCACLGTLYKWIHSVLCSFAFISSPLSWGLSVLWIAMVHSFSFWYGITMWRQQPLQACFTFGDLYVACNLGLLWIILLSLWPLMTIYVLVHMKSTCISQGWTLGCNCRIVLNSGSFMFRILFFMHLVWESISGFWPYAWETMNCTCEEGSLTLLKYNRWRPRLERRNIRSSWKGMEFMAFLFLNFWLLGLAAHGHFSSFVVGHGL